jgi:hypothetical protein
MDREQAVELARWHLDAAYRTTRETLDSTPGPDDHLEVIEESHDGENGRWAIGCRHTDGTVYRVALTPVAASRHPPSSNGGRRMTNPQAIA